MKIEKLLAEELQQNDRKEVGLEEAKAEDGVGIADTGA